MKNLKRAGAVLVFALGLGACGGGTDLVSVAKGFKEKTCACKDQACLDKVEKEMDEWKEKHRDAMKNKPSDSTIEKLEKLDHEQDKCKDDIMAKSMGAPATP